MSPVYFPAVEISDVLLQDINISWQFAVSDCILFLLRYHVSGLQWYSPSLPDVLSNR
jgi:hypothetical protein